MVELPISVIIIIIIHIVTSIFFVSFKAISVDPPNNALFISFTVSKPSLSSLLALLKIGCIDQCTIKLTVFFHLILSQCF